MGKVIKLTGDTYRYMGIKVHDAFPNFSNEGTLVECIKPYSYKNTKIEVGEIGIVIQASMTWLALQFGNPEDEKIITLSDTNENPEFQTYFKSTEKDSGGQNPKVWWDRNWQKYQPGIVANKSEIGDIKPMIEFKEEDGYVLMQNLSEIDDILTNEGLDNDGYQYLFVKDIDGGIQEIWAGNNEWSESGYERIL